MSLKNRIRKILNRTESDVDEVLKSICSKYDCEIHPKIRIADAILIQNSGINDTMYNYALSAHFDFLICNSNSLPLFAVEFDGTTHSSAEQIYKDSLKDQLCIYFEFPILRVSNRYNYTMSSELNCLSSLIEYYFACKNFLLENEFNPFKIISPSLIANISGYDSDYPLCPSFKIRKYLFNMHLNNEIYSSAPRVFIYKDLSDLQYKSLGYIEIYKDEFAISSLTLKDTYFFDFIFFNTLNKNLSFGELLTELTMTDLFSKTKCILDNMNTTSNISNLETLKDNYNKYFKFIASF